MKTIIATISALLIAGCGTIGNKIISDEDLQDKAAFALNTTADQVTISNRRADMQTIRFVATVGKKSHQCYVTSMMAVSTSDALCSGSNSVRKTGEGDEPGGRCNALLKAAGRC